MENNSVEPDQTAPFQLSDLDLHICLGQPVQIFLKCLGHCHIIVRKNGMKKFKPSGKVKTYSKTPGQFIQRLKGL